MACVVFIDLTTDNDLKPETSTVFHVYNFPPLGFIHPHTTGVNNCHKNNCSAVNTLFIKRNTSKFKGSDANLKLAKKMQLKATPVLYTISPSHQQN